MKILILPRIIPLLSVLNNGPELMMRRRKIMYMRGGQGVIFVAITILNNKGGNYYMHIY